MTRYRLVTLLILISAHRIAKAEQRDFVMGLPVVTMTGEVVTRVEYNLWHQGAVGLEYMLVQDHNLYSRREAKNHNDDSILVQGQEVGIYYSRFSNAAMLSGFYWAAGIGYRHLRADWKRTPTEKIALAETGLRDEEGRISHALVSSGFTGRLRTGYRYVGEEIPVALGLYLGFRYYNGKFRDRNDVGAVGTPDDDVSSLQAKVQTAFEPGIEFGMSF